MRHSAGSVRRAVGRKGGNFLWPLILVAAILFTSPQPASGQTSVPAASQAVRGGQPSLFDKTRYPNERKPLLGRPGFPHLGGNFEVLAASTPAYNCIAHSLGIHDKWINPQTGPTDAPLSPMDQMYLARGYYRSKSLNFQLEPGKQKVVVYGQKQDGYIAKITHAAIQTRKGLWTSKLGKLALISHLTPQALSGPDYGVPVAVYVKSTASKTPVASLQASAQ